MTSSCTSKQDQGPSACYCVTVIGIGAMGGGMARVLLESDLTDKVIGYDRSVHLMGAFHQQSKSLNKHISDTIPTSLEQAIVKNTENTPKKVFAILTLVNEAQCDQVCFGSTTNDSSSSSSSSQNQNLLQCMPHDGSGCVILCATVTATWARHARDQFATRNIHFIDSPMSGGPSRARNATLTLMASGGYGNDNDENDDDDDNDALSFAMPILKTFAASEPSNLYIVRGGVGMGSTVKMVHQLLAGVHIAAAAEALALAAKAGIDVQQLYQLVNGAAGASWMFKDRGARMISNNDDDDNEEKMVFSSLDIFIKDLGIVHSEAKSVESPIPLASMALQQFISGKAMGLGKQDDSQVIQVYEAITGVPVKGKAKATNNKQPQQQQQQVADKKEGDNVGNYWKMEDGTMEEILEVGSEPRHNTVLLNEYVRALRVAFPPNDTTLAHRHAKDSLYFFLTEGGLEVLNHIKGDSPAQCDCMGFGEIRYGTHETDRPLVHKITNKTSKEMLCIDAEILRSPPVTSAIPLVAEHHTLVKIRDKCRVYKLSLKPGESVKVTYPFFYVTVVLKPGTVKMGFSSWGGGPALSWEVKSQIGDVAWKEPVMDLTQINVGTELYEVFIAEWR